ncbi:hypothetical protein NKI12_31400 [Mesorhizobium australicum]|uniref:Uncharacterized protein n=1 Tax=Mesorhizobium australicum TaxID=536018 RepID=A0ACC6T8G1_9HYPH
MEDQSVGQPGIVVDDRIKDHLIDAAGVFLDLSAADADWFRNFYRRAGFDAP